jgi:hypothetical protein
MNRGSRPRSDVDMMIVRAGVGFVSLFELLNRGCIDALNATFK